MVSVFDVAAFILIKWGRMSAMKLQKLLYYCQAWSLVWDDAPLFPERIEAWESGPVVRDLFNAHKGKYWVTELPNENPDTLNEVQKETVIAVYEFYGGRSAQYLSDLTHMEDPWKLARASFSGRLRGDAEITVGSLEEYYSSLPPE